MKKLLVLFVLCSTGLFGYVTKQGALKHGTYMISGRNSSWDGSAYHGEVVIMPQGENYYLVWKVGAEQIQTGVGILSNGVLSVAYLDKKTGLWGVGAFRLINDREMEGRWTTFNGTLQNPEYLAWKGY